MAQIPESVAEVILDRVTDTHDTLQLYTKALGVMNDRINQVLAAVTAPSDGSLTRTLSELVAASREQTELLRTLLAKR